MAKKQEKPPFQHVSSTCIGLLFFTAELRIDGTPLPGLFALHVQIVNLTNQFHCSRILLAPAPASQQP
jgi:hypothetical protein